MLVRRYKKEDVDILTSIWYEATLIAHSFIPKELWDSHIDDLKNKYLPEAETWVVEECGESIGFISLTDAYIGGLFITPRAQGKGAGSMLVEHIKGIREKLTVGVYKENQRAYEFYLKCGFAYQSEEFQKETGHIVITMVWEKH